MAVFFKKIKDNDKKMPQGLLPTKRIPIFVIRSLTETLPKIYFDVFARSCQGVGSSAATESTVKEMAYMSNPPYL